MLTSNERILTTHVGSLPRNGKLTDLLIRREAGEAIDPALLAAEMDAGLLGRIKDRRGHGHGVTFQSDQLRLAAREGATGRPVPLPTPQPLRTVAPIETPPVTKPEEPAPAV